MTHYPPVRLSSHPSGTGCFVQVWCRATAPCRACSAPPRALHGPCPDRRLCFHRLEHRIRARPLRQVKHVGDGFRDVLRRCGVRVSMPLWPPLYLPYTPKGVEATSCRFGLLPYPTRSSARSGADLLSEMRSFGAQTSKPRRAVRTQGHFPSDEAAAKSIYLAQTATSPEWKRFVRQWQAVKNRRAIMFENRFPMASPKRQRTEFRTVSATEIFGVDSKKRNRKRILCAPSSYLPLAPRPSPTPPLQILSLHTSRLGRASHIQTLCGADRRRQSRRQSAASPSQAIGSLASSTMTLRSAS